MNEKDTNLVVSALANYYDYNKLTKEDGRRVLRIIKSLSSKRFNKQDNICDCTAPQLNSDRMCICGKPISEDDDWTNDSGYSDVFN